MKIRSFSVKICLYSVFISGIVLLVFGLYFILVINKISYDRIDRELRVLGEEPMKMPPPAKFWKRYDESLQIIYGETRSQRYIMKAMTTFNEPLYASPHWPKDLLDNKLPSIPRAKNPVAITDFPERNPNRGRGRGPDGGFDRSFGQGPDKGKGPGPDGDFGRGPGKGFGGPKGFLDKGPGKGPGDGFGEGPGKGLGNGYESGLDFLFGDLFLTPPPLPNLPQIKIRGPAYANLAANGINWRVMAIGNDQVTMYIGMDMAEYYSDVVRFRNTFLIIFPLALILLSLGGWLIAQRALRPVQVIADTAGRINNKELGHRIPAMDADVEFAGLIEVINGMLDRLEVSFQQAIRFSGDAAHELKTPLTILQGELERAIHEAPAGSELQQKYRELMEEVRRLATITQKLLLLSQADSGQMKLYRVKLNLSTALDAIEDDFSILAPNLKLEKEILPDVYVNADEDLLNQVLYNLLSNAIKYNTPNGWIKFVLRTENQDALLSIINSSHEIPETEQPKIFDRFYRVDKSHNRDVDGNGLGLNLSREIMLAHKGSLVLDYSKDGQTAFTLRIGLYKDE